MACHRIRYICLGLSWWICAAAATASPVVWSGLTLSFSKSSFADPTLPENQDRITDHVALTRGSMAGIYNAVLETSFDRDLRTSPLDTEWATDIYNSTQAISAGNWSNLDFTTWSDAYGQQVGPNIVDRNAVVHLITDDIYLDIKFTGWSGGESGGAFTYLRAQAPIEVPTGDYNHNGAVDASDFVVWRDTYCQIVSMGNGADGNANGTIDSSDYTFWTAHFGDAVGFAAILAVPEPSANVVAMLGGCILCAQRNRIRIAAQKGFRSI